MAWHKWRVHASVADMSEALPDELERNIAELQKQVGANLRSFRESRDLTQDDLAHSAGLATRHLQKIETGRVNVTLRTLVRLGLALDIRTEALIAGCEEKNHP